MKPILCNTQVVQNILAGRQTQDRRPFSEKLMETMRLAAQIGEISYFMDNGSLHPNDESYIVDFAKYQPGDILWVRETFKGRWKPINTPDWYVYILTYKADGAEVNYRETHLDTVENWPDKWRPSIHMPKKFARFFRKVTSVTVELDDDGIWYFVTDHVELQNKS